MKKNDTSKFLFILILLSFPAFVHANPAPPQKPKVDKNQRAQAGRFLISASPNLLKKNGLIIESKHHKEAISNVTQQQLMLLKQKNIPYTIRAIGDSLIPPEYLDLQEIHTEMKALEKKYPKQAKWINVSQWLKLPKTSENRDIWALKLQNDLSETKPRPTILLDSIHHAREIITPMVTVDVAKQLLQEQKKNGQFAKWLKSYQIWIVPVVNPDGYNHVFMKDIFWRKNKRLNNDGSTGVDLNRNYPFMWGKCGKNSAQGKSQIYKGRSPASEPEIQTMVALGKRLRPLLYITFHAYGNEVLYPYVCAPLAESSLIKKIQRRISKASHYSARVASSSGESFEHFYNRYASLSYLIEVGKSFHPTAEKIQPLVKQARKTWQVLFQRGLETGIQGRVVDANTGKAIQAKLAIAEIQFKAQEQRKTRFDGLFHWLLHEDKIYNLSIDAKNYKSWGQSFSLKQGQKKIFLIKLYPKEKEQPNQEDSSEQVTEKDQDMPQEKDLFDAGIPEADREQTDKNEQEKESSTNIKEERNDSEESKEPEMEVVQAQGCQCDMGIRQKQTPTLLFLFVLVLGFWFLKRQKISNK